METAPGDFKLRVARAIELLGVLCLVCAAWMATPAHAAVEARVFDPTLSLTGLCTTNGADEVVDPWCPGPPGPSARFESPNITIDSFGNMYVASFGKTGSDGRIDVFSPEGQFITEFEAQGPRDIAVDSLGHLYLLEYIPGVVKQISRFSPTTYEPSVGKIAYENPPVVVVEEFESELGFLASWSGLVVDASTGHFFVSYSSYVAEFGSVAEENKLLDKTIGEGVLSGDTRYLAVDTAHNRLLVAAGREGGESSQVRVFELRAPHEFLGTIDGSGLPGGKFLSTSGNITIDADEASGHIFVSDLSGSDKVYEFGPGLDEAEEFIKKYEHKFGYAFPGEIAIDNASSSPNRGTLFVPSESGAVDHTYAFKFELEREPVVESISFAGVTEDEAVLRARVNPEGTETAYRFEYLTERAYEEAGESFSGAALAGEGTLAAGIEGVDVSAAVTGLEPGVVYHFRVVMKNSQGEAEAETRLRTYPAALVGPCANDALRAGLSALLPDCRAYELVSPPDTNGRSPLGVGYTGVYFPTLQTSPEGDKATFRIEGGSLPGSEGSGAFNGENYLSTRTATGWSTEIAAPSGTDYLAPLPGGVSPDQEYSFWGGELNEEPARYLRYPDGHSALVGQGSLGEDHNVEANLIAAGGAHVIFTTRNGPSHLAAQLEPDAPPAGTTAVYDRTADEVTHVVSLLPGELTPASGQNATYVGASYDGEGIAFKIGATLYLRYRNEETFEIGAGVTYAGVSEGGGRIFYLEGDDLFAFDVASEETVAFSASGDVTPVNVAADGGAAYLISPSVLTTGENPNGAVAQAGKDNLYLSEEGAISFVATVTALDVEGEPLGNGQVLGLGLWVQSLAVWRPGQETSRVTHDGSVLLFESEAQLGDYDPEGFKQIYRYDVVAGTLDCLSCNPTLASATSDASLQTVGVESTAEAPVSTYARMPNLSAGGDRAFFQSSEALVLADTDGLQDVYEWEAQGVGSCQRPRGCVHLISYGNSARDDFLFSASESGDDVFFLTTDLLVGADRDATASLYDARVGGGFPEAVSPPCQEEGCRPVPTPSPSLVVPHTPVLGAAETPRRRKCPKGKRKVTRNGKTRCVKKPRKHRPRKVGNKRAVSR